MLPTSGASASGKSGSHTGHHAQKGSHGNNPAPLHAPGYVTLRNVGYFVREHAGKFGFMIQVHDEPGKHEYEPAGCGKGIQ